MSLLEKLKKTSTVKATEVLSESKLFNKKDLCPTDIPIVNVALSGSIDGGLSSGLTVIAGPSKHFKSNLSLLMASAYLKKHKDAVCLLYDTEFGITPEYLQSMEVDPDRCIHTNECRCWRWYRMPANRSGCNQTWKPNLPGKLK